MRVSLVCPTNYHGESATKGIYYPMGILLVGSLVKDNFPNLEVNVVDGELYTKKDLEEKVLGSDVLGLSANTNNYQHCVNLANFAKSNGTKQVIIGGPHASAIVQHREKTIPMAETILRNQPNIDAVIVNGGEESFLNFLRQSKNSKPNHEAINNLFWRDHGEIRNSIAIPPTNPPRFTDMDFRLMDFEKYWKEHKGEFPDMSEKYIEGFTHIGCSWRDQLGCSFCDIPYPINNYQAPGRFWRDLREARNQLGINSFKDFGDCFTGNHERVRAFLDSRPSDLEDIEMSCYGRSSEITKEMADMLKDLNVKYIYVGFDSGDNRMLKSMREGYSVKANYTATERLAEKGINVTGSLILGATGESRETIANTENFARDIIQYSNLTQLYCAILTPFPGAPMNRDFLQAFPEFANKDIWDTEQTKRFWIERNCNVSYDYIDGKAREINDLNPSSKKRYFGIKK